MSGVASAIVGGSVVSGVMGASAAKKGAKASQAATEASVAEQRRQFDLVRGDTQYQRDLGQNAAGSLSKLYGYGSPAAKPLSYEEWVKTQPMTGGTFPGFGGGMIPVPRSGGNLQQQYQQYLSSQPKATGSGKPDLSVFFNSPDYAFNLQEGQKAIDNSAIARGGLLSGAAVKAGQRYASGLASREYSSFVDRLMQQAGLGTTGIGASANAGANAANNISSAYAQNAANKGSAYMQGAGALNNAVQGGIGNFMLYKYLGAG